MSKTDIKGYIQYANPVFMRIGGFEEDELIGTPHSILRHPHMPRCVFKLLWERIQAGQEIFAYVVNRAKNGDHYWVLAHVTPSFDANGKVTGYHSNRRVPERKVIEGTIIPLYQKLLAVEQSHSNSKDGMNAAYETLTAILNDKGVSYDEFIFSLQN